MQKQYRAALAAFGRVLTRWPNSPKVPPSLLKIGFAFYELGDMKNARASLTKLLNLYPNSSAVSMARHRLQDIAMKEKELSRQPPAENLGRDLKKAATRKPPPPPQESPGDRRIRRLAGE